MADAIQDAETYIEAAAHNRADPWRKGAMLEFPDYGQLVMTGDLHGHRRNFERLQKFCDLENAAPRHVILHEIIHEDVVALTDVDMSHEVLACAARWKCEFPEQVHFLQSNHELAQINGHEITKNGRSVTIGFEEGVAESYGRDADRVMEAIDVFLRSYPLAGRTSNRVLLSHSLPASRDVPSFDATVLRREPTKEDMVDGGSAHMLVWGRYQTLSALNALAELLDVDFFICGHQPQEDGYEIIHDRMVILASDHNHGVFLPLDLNKAVTLDGLTKSIRPFAAIA
ncbi:MAG: hypothetical protein IH987_05840 [Planctomycetes bacterium]|nr:hypothetical protein [Planctomycetota bacterium]